MENSYGWKICANCIRFYFVRRGKNKPLTYAMNWSTIPNTEGRMGVSSSVTIISSQTASCERRKLKV